MATEIDWDDTYIPWDKLGNQWDKNFEGTPICLADIALGSELLLLLAVGYLFSRFLCEEIARKSGTQPLIPTSLAKHLLTLFSFTSLLAIGLILDHLLTAEIQHYESLVNLDYSENLGEIGYYGLGAGVLAMGLLGLCSAYQQACSGNLLLVMQKIIFISTDKHDTTLPDNAENARAIAETRSEVNPHRASPVTQVPGLSEHSH